MKLMVAVATPLANRNLDLIVVIFHHLFLFADHQPLCVLYNRCKWRTFDSWTREHNAMFLCLSGSDTMLPHWMNFSIFSKCCYKLWRLTQINFVFAFDKCIDLSSLYHIFWEIRLIDNCLCKFEYCIGVIYNIFR